MALLRKEKPKAALKDLCIDQLEVFLSKGTYQSGCCADYHYVHRKISSEMPVLIIELTSIIDWDLLTVCGDLGM